ncbi:MAG TPA: FxLYD domain-containing protein [Candidatus Acidoferrales bacterium]|jgi:hypothetical protein|nr:FxLYD domain-containing protein [Candidatus Acidoferrales bacterium]
MEEEKSRAPIVLLVGVVAALLLIGAFYVIGRLSPAPTKAVEQPLAMGAQEQAYVPNIQFLEPKLSRAANFLNQEVTFVFGTVSNNGSRPIRQIEITLEFHDPFGQVILRDKERLFSPTAPPLAPHQQRDFQLGYETIPVQWNQTYPTIRITGLQLQ